MEYRPDTPFDSIEDTQEYFGLLSESLVEVKRQIESDIAGQTESTSSRRLEALRLVLFKLQKLEENVHSGARVLNDLRMLRRLLLHERDKHAEEKLETR